MKYFIPLFSICLFLASCGAKNIQETVEVVPEPPKFLANQDIKIQVEEGSFVEGSLSFSGANQLVIMVAGSGPTDRNSNSILGINGNTFSMIANMLSEQGISSFRYDKRGIGASSDIAEEELSLYTFVYDLEKIINHFSSDFDEIILLGHSEGAMISTIAAQDNDNVQSLILASGISSPLDEIVLEQVSNTMPPLLEEAQKHVDEIKTGQELSEVNPILRPLFRPSVVNFLISAFEIDPAAELTKVNQSILIINGGCDIQVTNENAEELHASSANSQLQLIGNMGHVLKNINDDCSNVREAYSDPDLELNPLFVSTVLEFIGE